MKKFLTIKEASDFLGVSEKTVRRRLKSGQLVGRLEGKYLIDNRSLRGLKDKMSSRVDRLDNLVQLKEFKGQINDLIYQVKEAREESRELRSIIYNLAEMLPKALPSPKKRWWKWWEKK